MIKLKRIQPIFIENSTVPSFLSFFAPIEINAIALFPFVFCRDKLSTDSKRHEIIHFQQQLELGVLIFYLIYAWDFCVSKFKGLNGPEAYLNIRAEKEAYENQSTIDYLSTRKRWQWLKRRN